MFTRGAHGFCPVLMAVFALGRGMAPGEPTPVPRLAPDGKGRPPQYTNYHWTSANGLPASTIQCLLQTRDGYLWLGTRNGLVRFNGKEFRTTPGMNCRSLAEDSDGVLWIGCSDGLARWDGIDFKSYRNVDSETPDRPREVLSLCPSREGGIWVGWEGELWRARNGKLWKVTSLHRSLRSLRSILQPPPGSWFSRSMVRHPLLAQNLQKPKSSSAKSSSV
jgi:ligand-binding sensor domain-containing protein